MLHTHTAEPGKPWKARGRKKRTHDGPTAKKQRRGGGGTDGPPEPTYTAKRTWQKQSTHLNPTTHYGEASRRVIKDQWGLVGEKRNQQKLIGTQVPKQDSVPNYLKVVRYSLSGTVVKSCLSWHKRLSSSIELGAQFVSPHQTTIKRKKHTWKACACLSFISCHECHKLELQRWKKLCFWLFRATSRWKSGNWRGKWGRQERRDFVKKAHNSKANCFTLLKRIANSKV